MTTAKTMQATPILYNEIEKSILAIISLFWVFILTNFMSLIDGPQVRRFSSIPNCTGSSLYRKFTRLTDIVMRSGPPSHNNGISIVKKFLIVVSLI